MSSWKYRGLMFISSFVIPRKKVLSIHLGVSQNFVSDTSPQVFALMIGNACRSTIRMPEELMAASLPYLLEA
jgi:hypothetical protein